MKRLDQIAGMDHRGGTNPVPVAYIAPGIATYCISAIDTLTSQAPLGMKLTMLATSDVASGALWPVAWIAWLITSAAGLRTPLQSIFGF